MYRPVYRLGCWLVLAAGMLPGAARADAARDYAAHVKPLLAARCYACHGALEQKARLRLDTAEAIRRAIWLGQHSSSELTLFSSLDVSPQTEDRIRAATEAREHTVLDDAQQCLDDLARKAESEGVSARSKVVFGHPWLEMTKQVLREGHDLVLVGTRQHSANQKK